MEKDLQHFIQRIDKLNWEYLAEGNSCVVFSCRSHQIVLRVKKDSKNSNEFSYEEKTHYLDQIIRPIFQAEKYFIFPQVLELPEKFLKELNEVALVSHKRPDERQKSVLDRKSKVAFLLPHVGFIQKGLGNNQGQHSFAVEIKPKWGALPDRNCKIAPENMIKFSKCRFCMQQYLKLKLGKISKVSEYCPLDLYSKEPSRVKRALCALFHTPQNNLRVFFDGQLVYSGLPINEKVQSILELEDFLKHMDKDLVRSEDDLSIEWIVSTIAQILIKDSRKSTGDKERFENIPQEGCDDAEHGGGVLDYLLAAQEIDKTGIEEVFQMYQMIQKSNEFNDRINELANLLSETWNKVAEEINKEKQAGEISYVKDDTLDDAIYKIQKFLVAASFKDCSIMITFQKQDTSGIIANDTVLDIHTKNTYEYQIKLIDLDPKSVEKIPDYFRLDQEIIRNYLLMTPQESS